MAHQAAAVIYQSFPRAADYGGQAVELGERHGWTDDPAFGVACMVLGTVLVWQGRLDEGEPWVQRAERTLTAETQPAAGLVIRNVRGVLELARGQDAGALAAFQAAERLAQRLATPHYAVPRTRALLVHALARLGETERAGQVMAALGDKDHEHGELRVAAAELRLARDEPPAALAALVPVLDGSAHLDWPNWLAHAYMLEATARDALGDPAAADSALERALDLAEPDGDLTPFYLYPAPGLLERHARHHTAHASLIAAIQSLLAGTRSAPSAGTRPPQEPLSDSETRVLRYLPTNLTAPEIARELSVSPNTIKTHVQNLYAKLGTHRRAGAVERARALGLLAPSGTARARSASASS